jgi:Tol biopolymer transport system component
VSRTVLSLTSVVLALLLACVVSLLGVENVAEAAFPGTNGKIAFQSNRDTSSGEIYTITPGGTATRITFSNGSSDPAYSPDGSRIAFVSANPGGTYQIFVMNADGSGRRQITTTSTAKKEPTWSPDGTRIAYVASSFDVDGQTDFEIWAINADGSGRQQLTNNSFPDAQPAWSPLGDKIAFVSTRTGDTNRNVYIMNSNGTGQTSITPNSPPGCSPNCYQGHDDNPAWSPNDSKIAYVHGYGPPDNPLAGGGVPNIWTMDPNGANKTNVSNNPDTSAFSPAWSPNGARIAYAGTAPDSSQNIYVMNANGSGQAPIDTNTAKDEDPDWQPIPRCATTDGGPNSHLAGTSGNDNILGTAGNDVICGLGGNDTINGLGGNDIILGGAGNDRLTGALGNDTLNGGPGTDTALYSGSRAVRANFTTEFATGVGSDVLLGVENLSGSNANDRLTGSAVANVLVGGKGADALFGLGGADTLRSRDGVNGNDTLNGGPGTDKCVTDARERSITSCP